MKRMVFSDLSGTILDHETKQLIPGMIEILEGMKEKGWDIHIVTDRDADLAEVLLYLAGIPNRYPISSSSLSTKGEVVKQLIEEHGCQESIFLDDWHLHLDSVSRECEKTRVIGFLGSKKYEKDMPAWCDYYNIPCAKTPNELKILLGC